MVKKRRVAHGNSPATKSKLRQPLSPQSGEEVLTARDRLKNALQDSLAHSDEDTDSSDDESDHNWQSSRVKRLSTLKKKQTPQNLDSQNESKEAGYRPFVMKLFDRSVDLAQFTEASPLYPICRAWVANHPQQAIKSKSASPEIKEEPVLVSGEESNLGFPKDICKLPPPDTVEYEINSIRIPPPIPYQSKYPTIEQDSQDSPTREQLLQDNLEHWTKVRQSWLEAGAKNEKRYTKNFKMLLGMLNK